MLRSSSTKSQLKDVAHAIKRVQHRHHTTLDAQLAPIGTTLVQWDALRHIDQNPHSSSHELAQLTFQTDQSFGTLATRLEGRGLIERYAGDGRKILHRLTPVGRKLLREGYALVDGVMQQSFSALKAGEVAVLYELMTRMLATPLTES